MPHFTLNSFLQESTLVIKSGFVMGAFQRQFRSEFWTIMGLGKLGWGTGAGADLSTSSLCRRTAVIRNSVETADTPGGRGEGDGRAGEIRSEMWTALNCLNGIFLGMWECEWETLEHSGA